ncbi:MAG: dihydrolipoyl dehydrogenase, partial [Actinomycetota bacterium]
MATYDLVILGAGSGGYAAALRGSQLGLKVALIERDVLGGTCLHRGCIPTKALLHAGEMADGIREAASFGIKANLLGVDMPQVNDYKDGVVNRLHKGLQGLVKHRGVDYITGDGKFVSPNKVMVGDQVFEGKHVVLATGSFPKSLPGLEIDGVQVINSEHALKISKLPSTVIILGGGVIGVEFASIWKSLGADVTIIEGLPRLVPSEDESVSKGMEKAFKKRGIKFSTGIRFAGVDRTKHGVVAKLEDGQTFAADLMLVAVGRGSATRNQGFEDAGLEFDGELIKVNENLQTNIANVYAVGDIVRGPQLAHKGFQEGIFVAEHIKGLNPRVIDISAIPRVTYSEPEIASVG